MSTKLSQFEAEALKLKINSELSEKGFGIDTLAQMWKQGLDLNGANPERPTKPYSQNSWVYACVNAIVRTCRGIQMMVSTANDDVVESGPAYDLLLNNPEVPFTKFLTETIGFLTLYRECYWVYLDKDLRVPKSILVAGPNTLKPVVDMGVLTGYQLRLANGRQVPLFLDDVWPLLDFNPGNPYHGIGPAVVGKLAISASYQASLLNEATLANGGKIGNLITTPGRLDPDEKQMLIAQFDSRHKSARNAGRTCLMTGGADVKNLAQTMADLQMLDLSKFHATEICILFDVPPEVIGLNSEAQYAHGPAHQRFIANNIAPTLSFVAEHITSGILRRFKNRKHASAPFANCKSYIGRVARTKHLPSYRQAKVKAVQSGQQLFAWFVIEEHPAMQVMLRERIEKVLGYTEKGVPLNACIDAFDLPFEHSPWGDDWWISAGLMPARYTLEAGIEGLTGPSLPEGEEEEGKSIEANKAVGDIVEKSDERQRLRIWRNWATSWLGIEKEYTQALRTLFRRQQRIIETELKKVFGKSKSQKADTEQIIARVVFDLKKENGKLKVINHTFFEKASELGIRQSLTELLGLKGDQLKEKAEQVKRLPILKGKLVISTSNITGVNKVTQRLIARQLKQGLDTGEGLNELTNRIRSVFNFNRSRALRIARTQTGGAVSSGRHYGMKAAGVELKSWLTSRDKDVRDSHRNAEQKYAEGIPLEQPFEVDGELLMYPGDPAGSAANIINCRCVELAKRAAGKMFNMEFYVTLQFYSYGDMVRDKAA